MFNLRERITEDISEEHMGQIIKTIAEADMDDNESYVVDNAYLITCSEEFEDETPIARTAYTVTRSGKKTFTISVLGTQKKIYTISQKVTAAFNTYSNQVKIVSHSVTFTGYDTSYKLVSQKQAMKINFWDKEMVGGRIEVTIRKGSINYLIYASATVFNNEKFILTINEVY